MGRHRKRLIDANKIMYHQDWIARYMDDPFMCYPLYVEVSPVGFCNHRCFFCGVDYRIQEAKKKGKAFTYMDHEILVDRLHEMGMLGVKSIMLAGEGEPLVHKNAAALCIGARHAGIDVGITTNGTHLRRTFCEQALDSIMWIKVSLDAANPKTHARIHDTTEHDFPKIIQNISDAVEVRDDNGYECDIGAQMLLLPQNMDQIADGARLLRGIGADYLVVKPYSQHRYSINKQEEVLGAEFHYSPDMIEKVHAEVMEAAGDELDVEFRMSTMRAYEDSDRGYSTCLATPTVWAYISTNGDVYSCSAYLGQPHFVMGNIYHQSFEEIWMSERRREHLRWVKEELDISVCRLNCRPNAVNQSLTRITESPDGLAKELARVGDEVPFAVNFI